MTDNIEEIALEFARNVGFSGDLFYSHTSGYPQDACIEKRNEDGSKYPINELFAVNSIDDVLELAQKWCESFGYMEETSSLAGFARIYMKFRSPRKKGDEYICNIKGAYDAYGFALAIGEGAKSLPIAIMKAVNRAVREMKND